MNRFSLSATLALVALIVSATSAATASAASKPDPRGDAPRHADLVRGGASYGSAGGQLKARFALASYRGAASQRVAIAVYFTKASKGRCAPKKGAAMSFETATKRAQAGLLPPTAGAMSARARVSGNRVSLSVSAPQFARKRFNCAVVASLVSVSSTQAKVLDRLVVRVGKRALARASN